VLDFAVTKAEAVLWKYSRHKKYSVVDEQPAKENRVGYSKTLDVAIRLLKRLTPMLERELLGPPASVGWVSQRGALCFTPEELAFIETEEPEATHEVDTSDSAQSLTDAISKSFPELLAKIEKNEHRQASLGGEHAFWISKEPHADCGRGIQVFSQLMPLLVKAPKNGWNLVVQKYIEKPLLVGNDQRKCDVRLWVLVTSWNPAVVWVWSEPYFRLASRPFSWNKETLDDPYVHLTNRTVQKDLWNQEAKQDTNEEHIWMLSEFFRWGEKAKVSNVDGSVSDRWKTFTWPRILAIVRLCVRACQADVGVHPQGCFEFFGFDFMLDDGMKPWLLEANMSPDLCADAGPALRTLAETALCEMLQIVTGLHSGSINLPPTSSGGSSNLNFDQPIPGSGRWHLCLREETRRTSQELQLRRCNKATRCPTPSRKVGAWHQSKNEQHVEVLNALLGATPPHLLEQCPELITSPRESLKREKTPEKRRGPCVSRGPPFRVPFGMNPSAFA